MTIREGDNHFFLTILNYGIVYGCILFQSTKEKQMTKEKQGIKLAYNGEERQYGGHSYKTDKTSDCGHNCGCWAGGFSSGGPSGIDPLGICPGNRINSDDPENLKAEIDFMINARIQMTEQRAMIAENLLKDVKPGEIRLVEQIKRLEVEKAKLSASMNTIKNCIMEQFASHIGG
jgi:hypothetical protein